jgi:tetratricopeptide (TPR) repeat protein
MMARAELLFGPGALRAGPAAARIAARAEGNPFFIEELLNYIRDRQIDPRDEAAMATLDLPHSLHSLILSRIDQLAEQEQRTLKLASVIGRVFRADWLWGSYPEIGTPAETIERLDALSRSELTILDKPAPDLEYLFKHIATQEVPYESLALSTRQVLHGRIGDYIERISADSPQRSLDLLAFHYGRSSDAQKQRVYFHAAGDAARAAFANQTALDYYERLLPLLSPADRAEVLCAMGEILQLTGRWDEADARFHAALSIAEATGDPAGQARCRVLLGHLIWNRGDYPAALAQLEQAHDTYQGLGDRSGLAQSLGYIGLVYSMQGEQRLALRHLGQQASLAIQLNDRVGEAQALGHIGSIYQERGDFPAALEYYERQLAIAHDSGDRRMILSAIGNIGIVRQWQGDYPTALGRLGEVITMAVEIGDLQTVAVAAVNMGEVYRVAGSDAEALECYRYGLGALVEMADRVGITATIANIAQVDARQGKIAEAAQLIDLAIKLADSLSIPFFLAHCRSCRAEVLLSRGEIAAALEENNAAMRIAAEIELREITLKASLRDIELRLLSTQIDRAKAAAAYVALLEQTDSPEERAEIARHLWGLSGMEDYRAYAAEGYAELYRHTPSAEYRERYRELGGADLPTPPPLAPPPALLSTAPPLEALLARVADLV